MKLHDYQYKVIARYNDHTAIERSMQEFLDEYAYSWDADSTQDIRFIIYHRTDRRVVYSTMCFAGDRPPTYIVAQLSNGVSEEKAIPRKGLATIGELLKAKQ